MKMNKPFVKAALAAGLGLLLALLAAGCDNPAGGNDDETTISAREAAQKAANEFYDAYSVILEKPAGMLVLDDEELINAAWKAYGSLNAEAKALLPAEKAHLDNLKAKLEALKSAADSSAYYTLHDLAAYLAKQPVNGADTPYTIVYMGNETAKALYNILAAAGRYVDLNLGGSSVQGFVSGTEEGRAFIVSLTLPDSLTEIRDGTSGNETFANFSNLKSVYAAGVQKLGAYAFAGGCPALAGVSLPAATTIGNNSFYGCTMLTAVNLPAATTLGSSSFYNCASLATLSLPSVVTINGTYAFRGCTNLAAISLPAAVFIGYGSFRESGITSLSLPAATTIDGYVFYDCDSLATVSFPVAVSIGNSAFRMCDSLIRADLPAAVSVGQYAFQGCTSLVTVNLVKASSIDMGVFQFCNSLATVSLPSVVSIGYGVFQSCTSLVTVSLPSVASLDQYAFQSCINLTEVILGSVPPTIKTTIFYGAATTAKTITIKAPYPDLYTAAGTPWSDKMGDSSVWGTFWDTGATSLNLTVALGSL
jgi:hypothetical protein